MIPSQVLSEDVFKQAQAELAGGNFWIAYNTVPYFLEKGDVYFFKDKNSALEFATENISDVDHYRVLKASSISDLLRQIPYANQMESVLHSFSKNQNSMNEKNIEYLKDNLKYLGFGQGLNADLEKNISQRFPEFVLKMNTEINQQPLTATLYFRKGENSDLYFFNRWDGELKKEVDKLQQTFYLNKGQGITLKEGFNLLEGRAVHKELTNVEGQKYNAWLQLNFGERDVHGNFKLKQYHSNYGYDLEKVLGGLPIKELNNPEQKEMLLRSLSKGNIHSVIMEGKGFMERLFIEAAPKYKSLNIYDHNGTRVPIQSLADRLGLSEGKGKGHKQIHVKDQQEHQGQDQKVGKEKKNDMSEVTLIGKAIDQKPSKGKSPSL